MGEHHLSGDHITSNTMSSEGDKEYVFRCPECDESLKVNDSMKESLVDGGCVICGTSVTLEAFTINSERNSL